MKVVDGKFNAKKGPTNQEFLEHVTEFVGQFEGQDIQASIIINAGEFLTVMSNYNNVAEAHFDMCTIASGLLHGAGGSDEQYH